MSGRSPEELHFFVSGTVAVPWGSKYVNDTSTLEHKVYFRLLGATRIHGLP